MYALTAIKLAGGEETPRFEARITLDGKNVGCVLNDGRGGCCRYSWNGSEGNKFEAWIAANHPAGVEAEDHWVYAKLNEHDQHRRVVRASKKNTVFRLDGDPPDTFRKVSGGPLRTASINWLRDRYGSKLTLVFDPAGKTWIHPV
jgi:hypothetical protein